MSDDDLPTGCVIVWSVFVMAMAVAWIGALIWLVIAAISWLERH